MSDPLAGASGNGAEPGGLGPSRRNLHLRLPNYVSPDPPDPPPPPQGYPSSATCTAWFADLCAHGSASESQLRRHNSLLPPAPVRPGPFIPCAFEHLLLQLLRILAGTPAHAHSPTPIASAVVPLASSRCSSPCVGFSLCLVLRHPESVSRGNVFSTPFFLLLFLYMQRSCPHWPASL